MASNLHPQSIIYPGVDLGEHAQVGPFCIVGQPGMADQDEPTPTLIGPNAVIRSHTVIYSGNKIGAHFATGHGALIREDNEIGDDVSIGSHSIVEHHVILGNRVRIHSQAFIPEFSIVEEDAWIGPNVVFTNVPHPKCPKAKECATGPRIRRGAKIGANVTIAPGIEIGAYALVGAGSVVVKAVPPGAVVVGNPARILKGIDALTCPFELIDRPYPLLETVI